MTGSDALDGPRMCQASGRDAPWPWCRNARTLHGVPTSLGPIRARRLYRSDHPDGPAREILVGLRAQDINAIIDLRSRAETVRMPSPVAGHAGYRAVPMVDPRQDHLRDPATERHLLDLYRGSIDRNGRTIVAGLRAVADAPRGAVMVHCAAGKDRTGILVAVLLALLGAPDEAIIDDYARSEVRLSALFAQELANIEDPVRRERVRVRQHSRPDTMRGLLQHLREHHGGAAAYVRRHGLATAEAESLRSRLVL